MQQKQAVIEQVLKHLPGFQQGVDIALVHLTAEQLEDVKTNVVFGIRSGLIDYSKDKDNAAEVHSYGRSMVMNHLKKAKELNGGSAQTSVKSAKAKTITTPVNSIDMSLLPEDLKEFVENLV